MRETSTAPVLYLCGNRLRLRFAVQFRVALRAQRDQVQLGIVAGLTAKLLW